MYVVTKEPQREGTKMAGIRKRTVHCGKYGEKADVITASYYPHIEKKQSSRRRKYQESTPQQKNLNDKKSKRHLEALIHTNFGKGDICIHLTYRDEDMPKTIKEAQNCAKNYTRRINRIRKSLGLPNAKFIIITEMGKSGRVHHHVLMDGMLDRDTVEEKWTLGYCNAKRLRLNPKTGLIGLAFYVSKTPRIISGDADTDQKGERPKGGKRWISSQNLAKPWVSINDDPRLMSNKKFQFLKDLPEDSEMARQLIEKDNPGYTVIEIDKEYNEEYGKWYIFTKMKRKLSTGKSQGKSG